MVELCLFCKSFRRDLERAALLLDSIEAHNADAIPVVLSVPRADRARFEERLGRHRATLLCDEDLVEGPAPPGWRGQQIVKLHFARAGVARSAVLLDSDFTFLRRFGREDFLTRDGAPRFVVSERLHAWRPGDAELAAHVLGHAPLAPVTPARCEALRSGRPPLRLAPGLRRFLDRLTHRGLEPRWQRIHAAFGHRDRHLCFMPGPIVSAATLDAMEARWLRPAGLRFADLIRHTPFECHWIGEFVLATGCQELHPVAPRFLHFATAEAVHDARERGVTRAAIAERYLGVAMAAGHHELEVFD